MSWARIRLSLLLLCCLAQLTTGGYELVVAADENEITFSGLILQDADKNQEEGEKQEKEEKKEGAKGDECPATFGPILTDAAIPNGRGQLGFQLTSGLSFVTNRFSPRWRRISAEGKFTSFGMEAIVSYGILDNLGFSIMIPYIHNYANNVAESGHQGERSADFGGLGDIDLSCKYRLVSEGPVAPTISMLFATTFPSGHSRSLNPGRLGTDAIGGGNYAFTTGFNVSKYLNPFILYGNLWYTFQTGTSRGQEVRNPFEIEHNRRDFVTANLAAEYPLTRKWVALLELTSTWDVGRVIGPRVNLQDTALLSMMPGIEYVATDKLAFALGVNIDLAGKETNANVTPLVSVSYSF